MKLAELLVARLKAGLHLTPRNTIQMQMEGNNGQICPVEVR